MWNLRNGTGAALLALVAAGGCSPDEYPTEPRFEVEEPAGDQGHLFRWNVLPDVQVTSVNVAGSFQGWNTTETPMHKTWMVTVELPAGDHEYKYVFNGDQWAGDMCNDPTWGHPDYGNRVDPNGTGCVEGGGNATITMESAGPHTFMYIVPASAPEITSVNLAGSFQGWSTTATPMDETYALWMDLETGTHEYKFVFNGDTWADNMCNDPTWGDPANDFRVDANNTEGCTGGFNNAVVTID